MCAIAYAMCELQTPQRCPEVEHRGRVSCMRRDLRSPPRPAHAMTVRGGRPVRTGWRIEHRVAQALRARQGLQRG